MQTEPVPGNPAVLLVNIDDAHTTELMEALNREGFRPWPSPDRKGLEDMLSLYQWSLVMVKIDRPHPHSLQHLEEIRQAWPGLLVVLSAPLVVGDEVRLRQTGVDEVLVWPQPGELLAARLRTVLGRNGVRAQVPAGVAQPPVQVGGLTIDLASRRVRHEGRTVSLTDTELELLQLLARHHGRPVSRDEIFLELRGFPYDGLDRSIDLRISRLRRKLENGDGGTSLILTVRGVGYQLATHLP